MQQVKNNITLLNVISSIIYQFVIIISGFIVPRIVLRTFGSEVNGLVSSLNQFLNYITLFEGGLGAVALANMYKPLVKNDNKKLSSIVKTTKFFYRNLSIIFIVYTIMIGCFYPLFTDTSFSFIYILTLTLILSLTLFVQYTFSLTYRLLLQADKKIYIVSFTQIFLVLLNIGSFYLLSKVYPNIHFLKLISAIIFLLQPLIFNYFIKKYFNLDKNCKKDPSLLKERWDGFAMNIAAFIHNNTDITLLTLFTNLKIVSVYSVYALVSFGLRSLIQSISNGINPVIGQLYVKNDLNELKNKFELYEYIMFVLVFLLFSVGFLLITPFVLLYTKNVIDISYNEPILGYILMSSEIIYCIKEPYVSLAYSANKFKDITKPAYLEAIINFVVSFILVLKLGLIGVVIGTLLAISYRTIFQVQYFKNKVINRNPMIFYKKFIIFSLTSFIGIIICNNLPLLNQINIYNWILSALVFLTIFIILYIIISWFFYKDNLLYFKNLILNKFKHTK